MTEGTILLIQSKGFLPDQIRLHMRILARRLKREPLPYNHAEIVVRYKEQLMSMGARAKGAEMTPLIEYLDKHPNHLALIPKVPLSKNEIRILEEFTEVVCVTDKRKYQFGMFLAWIANLKTWGYLNWGEKGNKKFYCFELANAAAIQINRWNGEKPKLISIYDLYDNKHYRHD
jgi:hypothetical protein